jgi:hypothetical protein
MVIANKLIGNIACKAVLGRLLGLVAPLPLFALWITLWGSIWRLLPLTLWRLVISALSLPLPLLWIALVALLLVVLT